MQYSQLLNSFINQAREEIEPNAEWDRMYPFELAMLRTVLEMKAVLDARTTPVFTILPDVVDMLANELQGRPSYETASCSHCGATIPIQNQDLRFAARYTCPECGHGIIYPAAPTPSAPN